MSKNMPVVPGTILRASILAISCLALVDCSGASRGPQVMGPYIHPTISRARRPLAALTPMPPPDTPPEPEKKAETSPAPVKTTPPAPAPERRAAKGAPHGLPSLAANIDIRRSEVVGAAARLIGVRNSFDDRSFLGHVLRINDMLPDGADPATFTAADYLAAARATGRLATAGKALPGDIVIFRCDDRCGYPKGDPIAAGVVERVYGSSLEFIAYVGSRVRRCHFGEKPSRRGTRAVEKVIGTVSVGR